jgi:PIN domain nuclease of toxin-antitoxin system
MWFMLGDTKLSKIASDLINDRSNACLISPVNHWEMAIKVSLGNYRLTADFYEMWQEVLDRFEVLTIEPIHTGRLLNLPFHHKDPFDRLLVAQSLVEGIPLVSNDSTLDAYGITRVW